MTALCNGISHHTVNSNSCERESHCRKCAQQMHVEAAWRNRVIHKFLHSCDTRRRLILVHRAHFSPNGCGEGIRFYTRARNQRERCPGILRVRYVELGPWSDIEALLADVAHDTDDLQRRTIDAQATTRADRILSWKETPGECVIHDNHTWNATTIQIGEEAAVQ